MVPIKISINRHAKIDTDLHTPYDGRCRGPVGADRVGLGPDEQTRRRWKAGAIAERAGDAWERFQGIIPQPCRRSGESKLLRPCSSISVSGHDATTRRRALTYRNASAWEPRCNPCLAVACALGRKGAQSATGYWPRWRRAPKARPCLRKVCQFLEATWYVELRAAFARATAILEPLWLKASCQRRSNR